MYASLLILQQLGLPFPQKKKKKNSKDSWTLMGAW
jgi:hypothetical protein